MPETSSPRTRKRFGTFSGVFTPCVLMILGVILYLRLGKVTGEAGLYTCLLIIACSKLNLWRHQPVVLLRVDNR